MTNLLLNMNMNIKVTEVDEIMDIIRCSIELTDQIDINEFVDEMGHDIKMNDSYVKLKESIHRFNDVLAKCNTYRLVKE